MGLFIPCSYLLLMCSFPRQPEGMTFVPLYTFNDYMHWFTHPLHNMETSLCVDEYTRDIYFRRNSYLFTRISVINYVDFLQIVDLNLKISCLLSTSEWYLWCTHTVISGHRLLVLWLSFNTYNDLHPFVLDICLDRDGLGMAVINPFSVLYRNTWG